MSPESGGVSVSVMAFYSRMYRNQNSKFKDYCKTIRGIDGQATCSESEIGFGLLGGYQFNDFIALEAGVHSVSGFDVSVRLDSDGSDLYVGGGLEFKTGKMSFRVEYARYELDESDADVISIGLAIPL